MPKIAQKVTKNGVFCHDTEKLMADSESAHQKTPKNAQYQLSRKIDFFDDNMVPPMVKKSIFQKVGIFFEVNVFRGFRMR